MKTSPCRLFENAFILLLLLVYAAFAFRHTHPYPLRRIPIEGGVSYFVLSERKAAPKGGLPVVIYISSLFERPNDTLPQWIGQLDEPVILIWSDLLADLGENTTLEDPGAWERKKLEFPGLVSRYREVFGFDDHRVYLTGFGFAGAYAWMLAYDRPDLYAGVVAMSAPSYPPPIQQRLDSGTSVVTVVVYGEKDKWLPDRLAQAKETGQVIEARNPHSKFILKPGEGRREVARYWVENLRYVLQFTKEPNR
jgi:hypothetical protein